MSKKKKIIIGCSIASVAVIAVIVLVLCLVVFKPDPGRSVQVVLSGEQVYIQAQEAEDDYTYRFRFQQNGNEVFYDSASRTLDITDELWQGYIALGQPYNISVCYVDSAGVLSGNYGEAISYTFTLQLASPTLQLDGTTISWQAVRGADFYTIRYSLDDQIISLTTDLLSYDLSNLHGGVRSISVTSNSASANYRESVSSQPITATIHHELPAFQSASLNTQNLTLTITSSEYFSQALLTDDQGQEYLLSGLTCSRLGNTYVSSVVIRSVYSQGRTYFVRPVADSYNSFSGSATTVRI